MDKSHPLKQLISQASFPCVMAQTLLRQDRISATEIKGSSPLEIAKGIVKWLTGQAARLGAQEESKSSGDGFRSYAVTLPDLSDDLKTSFRDFESFFWEILSSVVKTDSAPWDRTVSNNPTSPKFSFSIGGVAYFIIMLHPESPRSARRCEVPVLIFNRHDQFEKLRARGVFDKIKSMIRKKDRSLQGAHNPMLDDYGTSSEIWQYSGAVYDRGLTPAQCPFKKLFRMLSWT